MELSHIWEMIFVIIRIPLLCFGAIISLCTIIFLVLFAAKNKIYCNSTYFHVTKNTFFQTIFDAGKNGEYQTYKHLKSFEGNDCKFLFNIYIPKENNETTEIDVLMICPKGIFVFESKNYSGWIFGDESQKSWTQTLPQGRNKSHKEYFFNPIMQNKLHIKWLKNLLGEYIPMYSIIVFSERCTLKSIKLKSKDIKVINRYDLKPIVSEICNQISDNFLNEYDINNIYNMLYPYSQVNEDIKKQHIINNTPIPKTNPDNKLSKTQES